MIRPIVIIFVLISLVFAAVHKFAVITSLYWYYWWFDIVMHFWGGVLLGLGVHAFCTFSWLHCRPTLKIVLFTLLLVTISWEVFERLTGLYDPVNYWFDTVKDIIMGFSGGLIVHTLLSKYKTS